MKPIMPFTALFFLATILLCGCNQAAKPIGMAPAAVQVSAVIVKPYIEKSDYLGTLRSRKSVTLSPNVDGQIVKIPVTAGQLVKPGETIMEIDSRMQSAQMNASDAAAGSVQSDLAAARAMLASLKSTLKNKEGNLEYTKVQYTRYQILRNQGAVSQSDADSWKNNYTAAQADRDAASEQIDAQKMTIQKFERNYKQALASLQALKDELSYYKISAPFAGEIGDIPVKIGDHVTSATLLTTLTENHPLEVYISVPAEKAAAIRTGMHIALLSTGGEQYGDSEVIFIAPTVDANSQTVLVKSLYLNQKSKLRAEQTITAQIVWQVRKGISIPTAAVTQTAGKYYVFVAKEDAGKKWIAHQTEIEVYEIDGNSYQVKSGLQSGDRIVTAGIQRLADGAPIVAKSDDDESSKITASR